MDAVSRTTFEPTAENLAEEEAAFDAVTSGTDLEPEAGTEAAAEPDAELEQEQEGEELEPEGELKPEAAAEPEQQPVKEPTIADLLAVIEEQKTEQQKLRDKVFGKVGELQQKIDAVKPAATGLSPKAAERLKADFPELHEMLFGGTEEAEAPAAVHAPAQEPAPAAPDEFTVEQKMELRLLDRDHKDWRQVVTSPEFEAWKGSVLDPETAASLDETWNADLVSSTISQFKTYQVGEAAKADQQKLKQERLDDAVTARGIPRINTPSLGDDDEEAAMLAHYKPRS